MSERSKRPRTLSEYGSSQISRKLDVGGSRKPRYLGRRFSTIPHSARTAIKSRRSLPGRFASEDNEENSSSLAIVVFPLPGVPTTTTKRSKKLGALSSKNARIGCGL